MITHCFTITALVALSQAKAFITNQCPQSVYVWSVPTNGTANVELSPNGRYEEPWRYGSKEHPGIALKISTEPNGIYTGKDEINFAYSIDPHNPKHIWVDLSPVRGSTFKSNVTFHTPKHMFTSADVHTSRCQSNDNIELVLCGSARTAAPVDEQSHDEIAKCFDGHETTPTQANGTHVTVTYTAPPREHTTTATVTSHMTHTVSAQASLCTSTTVTTRKTYVAPSSSLYSPIAPHRSSIASRSNDGSSYANIIRPSAVPDRPNRRVMGTLNACSPKISYLESSVRTLRRVQVLPPTVEEQAKDCFLKFCSSV